MSGWKDTRTLDPGKTMVTFQALARPEGHWPRVEAMQRRRQRERIIANLLSALSLVAFLAGGLLLVYGLGGCSVNWTRVPDPEPGVHRYDVRLKWGVGEVGP